MTRTSVLLVLTFSVAGYEAALKAAELEFRTAQRALHTDDSNENRARYARALAGHDKLSAQLPFIAAGAGDVEV